MFEKFICEMGIVILMIISQANPGENTEGVS